MVAPILEAVRKRGDEAVLEYARKFDGLDGASTYACRRTGCAESSDAGILMNAVEIAAKNIREYAALQLPRETLDRFSRRPALGLIVRPLDSDGRLHSRRTLSAAVHVADDRDSRAGGGCANHLRHVPASERGDSWRSAQFLGVENIFQMGGAQAIAALAFGTETVPKVDRIVGPGNIYVAAAKKLLAGEVGIDFVAGPTEIVIIAAERDPRCIAADMLAQAEHDVDASSILLTTSRVLGRARGTGGRAPAGDSADRGCRLRVDRNNSAVILCPSMDAAVEASNQLAPEHLADL